MNRIREHNNKFQVLITPTLKYNTTYELLLGNWDDYTFRGFSILEFNNLESALKESLKHPDLDWSKLLLTLQYPFYNIKEKLEKYLGCICEITAKFMSPENLKNSFFDRVIFYGNNFNLLNHMSDIINFDIKCFDNKYLNLAFNIIMQNNELNGEFNIIKVRKQNEFIYLIGKSSVSITYIIRLS